MSQVVENMVAKLLEDVVHPLMSKFTPEEVQLCWDILVKESGGLRSRENEDHLSTPDVQEAVTSADISVFSKAMFVVDSMTSAAIRKQDKPKMLARNTFVHKNTEVTDILPQACDDNNI